jgi:hypothetical protein
MNAYENGCLPASQLTKRETIAISVLNGLCCNEHVWSRASTVELATLAVDHADALLKVLAGPEDLKP